jgi:hypothetical protein
MEPDSSYVNGETKFLVVGNECRLLDQRRTPGKIKTIDLESASFIWEITDFEDKGKFWEVELGRINTYQFKIGSKEASLSEIETYNHRESVLNKNAKICVLASSEIQIKKILNERMSEALIWIGKNSEYFRSKCEIDFQNTTGPRLLRDDFNNFMKDHGLSEIDKKTTEVQVLNPYSGEWIKALQITMAEMGLKSYDGKSIRSEKVYEGIGSKENLKKYIEHRLGFLRAMFNKMNLQEVELYRGMSTDSKWTPSATNQFRYWTSWTFNYKVAQDFSVLLPKSKQKNSYLIKREIPVEQLFMTFLETDAMNSQYLEAEALVLHQESDRLLW